MYHLATGSQAWRCISTVKCFKKCCISTAVDGTDDDMLWNGSEQDGNIRSECVEDEDTDCEGGECDTDWQR